jgi:hypothetical protein
MHYLQTPGSETLLYSIHSGSKKYVSKSWAKLVLPDSSQYVLSPTTNSSFTVGTSDCTYAIFHTIRHQAHAFAIHLLNLSSGIQKMTSGHLSKLSVRPTPKKNVTIWLILLYSRGTTPSGSGTTLALPYLPTNIKL